MKYDNVEQEVFWIVWNPSGRNPRFRHPNMLSAINEAERLAQINPDQTFIVLKAVCARRQNTMLKIQFTDQEESDGIPF